jgi:tripartite-type tricarboxylate transporter receptor subunit TctC
MARFVQPGLQARLGQPVVIENRTGAGGNVGTDFVAKAPADGYTILFSAAGPLAVNKTLYKGTLAFDPEHDLRGVIQLAGFPLILAVNARVPVSTPAEFLAWARAAGDTPRAFASAGNGTPQHLVGELFARSAKVKLLHVPYRGSGTALIDVVAGQVPCTFENAGGALPHIRSGALRAIAVTSAQRMEVLPNVPTLSESLLPGFDFTAWNGVSAPRGTPDPVIEALNRAFREVLQEPAIRAKWVELGSLLVAGAPAQFDALVHSEIIRLGAIVTETGVKPD